MCGITGKLTFDRKPIERDDIHRMCEALVHRGPDAEGIYVDPSIGLGQRRLSIIDLSDAAAPPLGNDDGTVWLVLNGEIYNYATLRAELIARGYRFRTGSDTEVLLRMYEEYGEDCLPMLRGMFAFAVWNTRKGTLFVARDRLGKKPLFYSKTAQALIFGSEIKAILADSKRAPVPNYAAIDQYLTWQYVPSPQTAFEGIHKLPPAHCLRCDANGNIEVWPYWHPPRHAGRLDASPQELEHRIVETLRDCVRARMVADVPLGALLSGGIDSGSVVALMAAESPRAVKTFSIGFDEDEFNELPYARLVAERYGTDHHEFVVQPAAADILPQLVRHYDEPFADSSAIPTWYVSQLTRQHVTVALTGDGGDESFGGYTRYQQVLAWQRFDRLPRVLRCGASRSVRHALGALPYTTLSARLRRGLEMLAAEVPGRYDLTMSLFKSDEQRELYTDRFRALIGAGIAHTLSLPWSEDMDALAWMMRNDQTHYLPDCLMVKADIASMAHGLELRAPFLDHIMIEFAAGIPSAMKLHGGTGKYILRNAVRDLLPADILAKRKTGFGVPMAAWFRGELASALRALLLDERCARRGLFEPGFLRRMIDEHIAGRRDWSNRLWALLFLECWFREYID